MTDVAASESPETFLVLGGAGNTGSRIARLEGGARMPGLATMGNIVEPVRFVADLERLGVRVEREKPDPGSEKEAA